jgi:hypothetical protein
MEEALLSLSSSWQMSMPTLQTILLHLLLAFVLSMPLAWVYLLTHQGVSYSRSTVHALVLMSLIVTFVMLAIGESLARAFGLFGALALIRFRTPIKDTRDTVFLFLAVAIGIAVGTQSLLLAVAGTALALVIAACLHFTRFGDRHGTDGVLRVQLPEEAAQGGELERLLRRYCRKSTLLQVRDGMSQGHMELAYQLQLKDTIESVDLIAGARALPGAHDVSLLMQTEHEEL